MLYPEILYNVHQKLAEKNNLESNNKLDNDFSKSVLNWPLFSDTLDSLMELQRVENHVFLTIYITS